MPEPIMTPVRSLSSSVSGFQSGVAHRLVGGGDGVEDEVVDPRAGPWRDMVWSGSKLPGDVRPAAAASVDARAPRRRPGRRSPSASKAVIRPAPGLAGQDASPAVLDALTQGGDEADAGDDDATHGQLLKNAKPQTVTAAGRSRKGTTRRPSNYR